MIYEGRKDRRAFIHGTLASLWAQKSSHIGLILMSERCKIDQGTTLECHNVVAMVSLHCMHYKRVLFYYCGLIKVGNTKLVTSNWYGSHSHDEP